ncbi:MAG TPA: NUDIX hydrolase [Steroidobacteraceae bacterium]|nr:NUDIX hydrolase [Steroidobacteraceae bacterium]
MNFCSACGQRVDLRIPEGDTLPRYVCGSCQAIHYENPKIVVGCVPELDDGRILLCRRAIEPRRGYWTVPAGFMENDETLQAGAARESLEEALAHVEIGSMLAVVHVLHAQQVHIMFRARMASPGFGVGAESLEVVPYPRAEIPWTELAFRSVDFSLRRYFDDVDAGTERLHYCDIDLRRER